MSDQNQELLDAIAALMEQRQDGQGTQAAAPTTAADPEPEKPEDFEDRLAACERLANR